MPRKPPPSARRSRYKPHPLLLMEETHKAKLRAETGRSFDDWVKLARTKGPRTPKDLRLWLRDEHGIGMGVAMWMAGAVFAKDGEPEYGDPETLVSAIYAGDRAALLPIHDAAVDAANALGADVIATSCKTMVPIYRKHVFAELRPGDGAVEIRLALGESVPETRRLRRDAGRMPGDRLTHSVSLRSTKDVDAELRAWLAAAYANGLGKMARAKTAETPDDVAAALARSAPATKTWESCTDAMRRDLIQWITSAKQAETRIRRIGQAVARLAAGHRRMY